MNPCRNSHTTTRAVVRTAIVAEAPVARETYVHCQKPIETHGGRCVTYCMRMRGHEKLDDIGCSTSMDTGVSAVTGTGVGVGTSTCTCTESK
jgi:hypothetical protein